MQLPLKPKRHEIDTICTLRESFTNPEYILIYLADNTLGKSLASVTAEAPSQGVTILLTMPRNSTPRILSGKSLQLPCPKLSTRPLLRLVLHLSMQSTPFPIPMVNPVTPNCHRLRLDERSNHLAPWSRQVRRFLLQAVRNVVDQGRKLQKTILCSPNFSSRLLPISGMPTVHPLCTMAPSPTLTPR